MNPTLNRIRNSIKQGNNSFQKDQHYSRFKVNHISFNKDFFVKYWPNDANPHSVYNIPDLSFSFFISNLVDTLAGKSVADNNFIWFALDKEHQKIAEF